MKEDYKFEGQHKGEKLLLVFRSHPVKLRKPLTILLFSLLFSFIPTAIWPLEKLSWIFFVTLVFIGVIVFFYYWIGWYYSVYIVSDERLIEIKQTGLFKRKVVELGLDKIQNINYEINGFEENLLKYGTVVIQTFVGDLVLEQIHHPSKVQSKLNKILREYVNFQGSPVDSRES